MATVYLAQDLKHQRPVAIKVLRQELAASLGADRFLREVQIAAKLQHPHILTLIDSGEADGFLYYVMPFVDGETLRAKLAREGEFPVGDAVRIRSAPPHPHADRLGGSRRLPVLRHAVRRCGDPSRQARPRGGIPGRRRRADPIGPPTSSR